MMKAYIEDENEKLLEKMFHETEEEFAIEKNSVIQKGVAVVNKEFERKIERVEKETCMHNFSTLEAGYLKYLAAKHDHFTDIVEKAKDKIEATVHTAAYRQMLTNLIVQSLCFLMENNVEAIFREQDKRLGAGLLRKAAKTFRTMSGINCNIKVNEQQSLDPRSLGGVNLVAVPQRRIFVANNMKLRLHHVMEAIQPFIVQQLFSEEKKPKRRSTGIRYDLIFDPTGGLQLTNQGGSLLGRCRRSGYSALLRAGGVIHGPFFHIFIASVLLAYLSEHLERKQTQVQESATDPNRTTFLPLAVQEKITGASEGNKTHNADVEQPSPNSFKSRAGTNDPIAANEIEFSENCERRKRNVQLKKEKDSLDFNSVENGIAIKNVPSSPEIEGFLKLEKMNKTSECSTDRTLSSDAAGMEMLKNFLSTRGYDYAKELEFLPYFALPFVDNPKDHPLFSGIFKVVRRDGTRDIVRDTLHYWRQVCASTECSPRDQFVVASNNGSNSRPNPPRPASYSQSTHLQPGGYYYIVEGWIKDLESMLIQFLTEYSYGESVVPELMKICAPGNETLLSETAAKSALDEYVKRYKELKRKFHKLRRDHQNIVGKYLFVCQRMYTHQGRTSRIASELATALENSVRGDAVDLKAILENCDSYLNGAISANKYHNWNQLDVARIKKDLSTGNVKSKLLLLQSIRWYLMQKRNEERELAVSWIIRHDILGLKEGCFKEDLNPNSVPHPVQQAVARLVNGLASLKNGRDYLVSSPDLIKSLVDALKLSCRIDPITCDMLIASLQKLSLRVSFLRKTGFTLSRDCHGSFDCLPAGLSATDLHKAGRMESTASRVEVAGDGRKVPRLGGADAAVAALCLLGGGLTTACDIMLSNKMIEWLLEQMEADHFYGYSLVYSTSLLMNLLFRTEHNFWYSHIKQIIHIMIKLLKSRDNEVLEFVFGILYILLRDDSVNDEFRKSELLSLLKEKLENKADTDTIAKRQMTTLISLHQREITPDAVTTMAEEEMEDDLVI
ncbi:hypothetical protein AAG570_009277 [Ranatra chinensis]|uniref:Uncharacterized protein n=1 Tax=Ranatra chinensis TaxID=642074 RepID=A0ABD0YT90_9HEMI